MMHLMFIGEQFYRDSGTVMGCLYDVGEEGSGECQRSDWAKVNMALNRGEEVHIRPANEEEMLWAYRELERVIREKEGEGI